MIAIIQFFSPLFWSQDRKSLIYCIVFKKSRRFQARIITVRMQNLFDQLLQLKLR